MVLGMPMTLILRPRRSISSAMAWAPLRVPSPPTAKKIPMFIRSRVSTISPMSWGPREVPRRVPPSLWRFRTRSGFSSRTVCPYRGMRPS